MVDFNNIIERLNLQPLEVEGGCFKRVITLKNNDDQEIGSCIYYLVTKESYSSLHKVLKDEIWYFLEGDPLIQIQYNEKSEEFSSVIIDKASNGGTPMHLVEKNVWQSTILKEGGSWALVATTVIPGFTFDDFVKYDDEIVKKVSVFCDIKKFIY